MKHFLILIWIPIIYFGYQWSGIWGSIAFVLGWCALMFGTGVMIAVWGKANRKTDDEINADIQKIVKGFKK